MLELVEIFSVMSKFFFYFQIASDFMSVLHSYVFWFGDLNFRIREEFLPNAEDIKARIVKDELNELIRNDQLVQVRNDGRAFHQLDEKLPEFPPTFKFEEGTNNYDMK